MSGGYSREGMMGRGRDFGEEKGNSSGDSYRRTKACADSDLCITKSKNEPDQSGIAIPGSGSASPPAASPSTVEVVGEGL